MNSENSKNNKWLINTNNNFQIITTNLKNNFQNYKKFKNKIFTIVLINILNCVNLDDY